MLHFFLLLFALCLVPQVHATACVANPSATSSQCYALRASCHWVVTACLQGAPATCDEYVGDSAGCTSGTIAECAFNTLNGVCYTLPAACATLDATNCSHRSDCHAQGGNCVRDAAPATCGNYTTGSDCQTAGCYWDAYTQLPDPVTRVSGGGQCFFNLQEVKLRFACSHWSLYPGGGLVWPACTLHDCAPQNTLCVADDMGSFGIDGGYSLTQTLSWAVASPHTLPDTQRFQAQIVIPLAESWHPSSPVWYDVVLGTVTNANGASYLQPGPCTSIGAGNSLVAPTGAAVSYPDLTALYGTFLSTVQSTHSLESFDPDTADGLAIVQTIRRWNMSNGLVTRADILPGLTNLALTVGDGQTLSAWAALCPGGVQRLVTPTYNQFNLNLSLITTSAAGTAVVRQFESVTLNTYGAVQVSSTSAAALQAHTAYLQDTPDGCPLGQQKRVFTLSLLFLNALDPSRLVGLRNLSDVSMVVSGYAQTPGSPTNCFGTHPTRVLPPVANINGTCETLVDFETRCTPIPSDGDGLNVCAYQLAAARISDMGADVAYSTFLDRRHNFFIYAQSWPPGFPDLAVPAGQDASGATPDEVAVTLSPQTYPDIATNATLGVRAGLLPVPSANFSQILELSDTNGTTITDARNLQIYFGRTLTFVVYLPTADERQTFMLTLDVASLRIYPLSSTGTTLATSPPYITWTGSPQQAIRPAVSASPRQDASDPSCIDCALLPVATGATAIGIDGFAVPVLALQALIPANGYELHVNYNVTLPASGAPSARRRRLLQADGDILVTFGTLRMRWVYVTTVVIDASQGRDLGATGSSAAVALATTASVLLFVAFGSLLFTAYS